MIFKGKQQTKLNLILFFILLLLPVTAFCNEARFVIFHTSDIHGHITSRPDPTSKEEPRPMIGGFAVLKNLINNYKNDLQYNDSRILYFDSADYFQGTPIVDRTKGEVMIDLFNKVGLNVTTLGNHEFDYSLPLLFNRLSKRKFPVVCCNVFSKKTNKILSFTQPYKIFTHNGFKIGVVGVNAPNTPSISIEENVKDVYFKNPEDVLPPLIKDLKRSGVDLIILLSHLGYNADIELLDQITGIDLLLGGHSHTLLHEMAIIGPSKTRVVHSGAHLEHASRLIITLKKGEKPVYEHKLYPLYVDKIGKDKTIVKIKDEYLKELREEMNRVIGRAEVNLYRGVNGGDSPEGSFIADAMRDAVKTDFAVINFGGIRQPIFKGPVTVEHIFVVQPFNNVLEIIEMTGNEIKNLLERSVSNDFANMTDEDKNYAFEHFNIKAKGKKRTIGPDYGYLYPSNLTFSFDPEKPPMQRITQISTMTGQELKPDKVYTVAMNDFISQGGDGFKNLKKFKNKKKTDILVRDAIIKFIEKLKVIDRKPAQRIFNLRLKEEDLE
jgi:2',3'-cyclic-nucleotide 2'-phosphodiesterase (5'-nucleotidase family)